MASSPIEDEKTQVGSLKVLLKNKRHLSNLLVVLFLWVASAFDYFLINFQLKYIKGDIYINTIVSSVSEVIAYIISGAIFGIIGPKITFVSSYVIAIIGSVFYIIFSGSAETLVPVMILGSKFGIAAAFNCVWMSNIFFPPEYASTTLGLFNCFARLSSMLAPQFAEFAPPVPMVIFCIMAGAAAVLSFLLQTEPSKSSSVISHKEAP